MNLELLYLDVLASELINLKLNPDDIYKFLYYIKANDHLPFSEISLNLLSDFPDFYNKLADLYDVLYPEDLK